MRKLASLKTRFVLFFTLFIVALCSVITVLGIRRSTQAAVNIFAQMGVPIVQKASKIIDGDKFADLSRTLDDSDPFYIETQAALYQVKSDMGCTFLYAMAPKNGNIWHYIIDGSDSLQGNDFSPIGDEEDVSVYDEKFLTVLKSGNIELGSMANQGEWGWVMSVYAPIFDSRNNIVGIIGCDYDADPLHDMLVQDAIKQIIIALASIIIGLLLTLVFMRMIFNPLSKVSSILSEIANGEGDLTTRINLKSTNEIGQLASYFDQTLEKIKNLIVSIKTESHVLSDVGDKLSQNMESTAASVNQITNTIKNVRELANNQVDGVSETNSTIEQMSANIKALSDHIALQSESVSESGSAIEQMLANIQSVAQTLVKNADNVTSLANAAEFGKSGLQEVSSDIQGIAKESEGLLEVNAVIQNIASQTNLLSMNAAIEAAHAGEAGKGFAVVADEIRKLAENSSAQSKTISAVLNTMHAAIEKIKHRADSVIARFEAIDSGVKQVEDQEMSIRNAMEEQAEGSQQILQAVSRLNDITASVRDSAAVMGSEASGIKSESGNLLSSAQAITTGMNEMSAGAGRITTAVSEVNNDSIKNQNSIKSLLKEVSRFKVE
ncbi:MAG: hypothetical protein Ta2G_04210 [Termitinemataceae bacterium]|nr:MAG: hypothetical protein Ta2G_04210 [Termitinemataceae bacterium]